MSDLPDWAPETITANNHTYTVTEVRPPRDGDLYIRGLSTGDVVRQALRDYPYRAPRLIVEKEDHDA